MFVYISPAPASVLGEGGNGQVVGEGDIPYPECLLQHYTVILSPDWGCVLSCLSDVRMHYVSGQSSLARLHEFAYNKA